jgi:molecular chaperone GrpE
VTETQSKPNGNADAKTTATATDQQDQPVGNGVEEPTETAGSELETLRAERDDYLDQLRRTMADFANFKRRTDQERTLVRQLANRDLLLQIIEVQDDFARALGAIPEDQRDNGWVSGTAMIERKLNAVLERAGVTQMDALGKPFDPSMHEAVASDPGSSGEQVVEVFRTGYKIGDQVLRAAMVRTGDKPVA